MKKLQLSDVRFELPFYMNRNICLGYLKSIDVEIFDFDVYLENLDITLQRGLVWTDLQKSELILSMLKGIKIPPLSLVEHETYNGIKTIRVIDGKQRLTTLLLFLLNDFPVVVNGIEYYFDDLDDYAKRVISLYNITADVVYDDDSINLTPKEKEIWFVKWFNQINFTGTPQDKEHHDKLLSKIS